MSQVRFFTDEDLPAAIAIRLRAAGFDAVSTPEVGRRGETDPAQLSWAAAEGRVIVTFNVGDFARLHVNWLTRGKHHAGIVVAQQRTIGDILRRLARLSATLSAEDMHDRLEYLSNW